MSLDRLQIQRIVESVVHHTRKYLREECDVAATGSRPEIRDFDVLSLHDITAIVGLGGPAHLLIVASFERALLQHLLSVEAEGLDIAENEREMYLRETAAEVVNIILGHCTADLEDGGTRVMLTPPVVIQEVRNIHRPRQAVFLGVLLTTTFGDLEIDFVGPGELFDTRLNFLSETGE